MQESERLYEYTIPDNVLESKRFFGFRRRNWVEGFICAGIVGLIVIQVPFVLRVKIIFLVCLCVPVLLLNLVGFKDQSLFEVIENIKKARANAGEYHLRRPDCEERYKSGRVAQSLNGIGHGDSAADKVADIAKRMYEEYKSKH